MQRWVKLLLPTATREACAPGTSSGCSVETENEAHKVKGRSENSILRLLFKLPDQNQVSLSSGVLINSILFKPVWIVFQLLIPKIPDKRFFSLWKPFSILAPFQNFPCLLCTPSYVFLYYYGTHLRHGHPAYATGTCLYTEAGLRVICVSLPPHSSQLQVYTDVHLVTESPWPPACKLSSMWARTMSISVYSSPRSIWPRTWHTLTVQQIFVKWLNNWRLGPNVSKTLITQRDLAWVSKKTNNQTFRIQPGWGLLNYAGYFKSLEGRREEKREASRS